jgi:protein ImuB
MLWIALHFPRLKDQALARGHAPPDPGREALEAVAAWACRFTPRVSLEPPQGIALEVEGSLRFFSGADSLRKRIAEGLETLGFTAGIASGPTAQAALWRASGGGGALEDLPVSVTGLDEEALALLAGLGLRTLGDVLRLPREGVARRWGKDLVDALDRALGRAPEPREFFAPPARFAQKLELPAQVSEAPSALFALRRLLAQLEGFLAARQAGVRAFRVLLVHPDCAPTEVSVGLASAARGEAHFTRLLFERFQRLELPQPIEAVLLAAESLEPLAEKTAGLFGGPGEGGEEWLRLVERLQARLGGEAVHGLGLHEDHRPECAFCRVDFRTKDSRGADTREQGGSPGPRPLWLLEAPRPLCEGEFALLAGPERIESGWWDGKEARRDYFIARTGESLAWIYRERQGGWFVHGFFA